MGFLRKVTIPIQRRKTQSGKNSNKMSEVGRDLKVHPVPITLPWMPLCHLPLDQVPKAPSNLALNISRDGASTTSQGCSSPEDSHAKYHSCNAKNEHKIL